MRILISAYGCAPGSGSEDGWGWVATRAAATRHDVTVLTRKNNVAAIEAAVAAEPDLQLRVVGVDPPTWMTFWKKGLRGFRPFYVLWQREAARTARDLHAREPFELLHHVSMSTDWFPVGIGQIPDVPLVWGPVGGSQPMPWRLWRSVGAVGLVGEAVRSAMTVSWRRVFGDRAADRADLVVANNPECADRFRDRAETTIDSMVGIDVPALLANLDANLDDPDGAPDPTPDATTRTAVYAGRLLPWKGVALGIAALARPAALDWTYEIYGDGPDRRRLQKLADSLGVGDRVNFNGLIPRPELLRAVAAADALLFPSLHDTAGWAVAEAVTMGVPVVCLDAAGPPVLVGEAGVLVPVTGDVPAALAAGLADLPAVEPTDRWSLERLPDLLDEWYDRAIAASGQI